jgi:hypothetical protein
MTPQIWIGVVFAGAVVLFLMLAYFGPAMDAGRHAIIRFLCALCAGCAGGFLTGSALLEYAQNLPNGGKIAFTGVAGCGLFGLVLLTFPRHANPVGENTLNLSFPAGTTFQNAAKIVAQKNASVAILEGFETAEKNALVTGTLNGKGDDRHVQVLRRLGDLAATPIRPYTVTFDGNAYLLKVS